MSSFRRSGFMKHWFAVEAIPIYAVVGLVSVGAAWYVVRLARGPNVIWTKDNPTPWNTIKPNETTKMLTVTHQAEKSWDRKSL